MQNVNRVMTARSKYYNYFNVGEGKAACKNCEAVFPYSSRIGTNSIRNHIKNKHPEVFLTLDNSPWQQNHPMDENQNGSGYNEQLGVLPEGTFPSNSRHESPTQKLIKKRKSTSQYPDYNNGFSFDLQAFLASNQEPNSTNNTPANIKHETTAETSNSLYPQDLLNVLAGNDDSVCSNINQAMKQDVETIARNLSSADDSIFYLKTASEIVKKWPVAKIRTFVQDILKQAMEEDNKMRSSFE